jgi:opacity protein-like surface antigen
MKRLSLLLISLVFVTVAQLSAAAATSTLTINLHAQNGSGENGTATLTQMGADVKVVIALKGAPATTPQPAHIHDGTCADLKGVAYPLSNVVNGSSTSTVKGVTIDKLLDGKYAINVHESAANLGKYVSCGDIAKGAM